MANIETITVNGTTYNIQGGSGMLPHIVITSDAENTITVTTPSGSTITPTSTSSGVWECDVDEYGTYTVTATYDEYEAEDTVVVDTVKVYAVEIHIVTIPDGSTVLPTDDVETWLACAGIQDKAYTTLTEVLTDSETFNALLGDSNACAYMARSTTFATTLCADQYAMSMIGQYDVCCDALLSDATWASAIASSTYFENVLNVSVPTMTSDTTPSGVCSASPLLSASYPAYLAFDGVSNNNTVTSGSTNGYIGYEFTSPMKLKRVDYQFHSNAGETIKDYEIQGYDGSNWVTLKSGTLSAVTTLQTIVDTFGDTAYSKFRIHAINNNGGVNICYSTVQFYGRASSSEYIHGTNNESAYYLDGATQTPIVDPSTLSAGTYTFGSTVAKDPSDLTADYTKTIRITPNTKEIVLRPDCALYWYGYISGDIVATNYKANVWGATAYTISKTTNDYSVGFALPDGGASYVYQGTAFWSLPLDFSHYTQINGIMTQHSYSGTYGIVGVNVADAFQNSYNVLAGISLTTDNTVQSVDVTSVTSVGYVTLGGTSTMSVTVSAVWAE